MLSRLPSALGIIFATLLFFFFPLQLVPQKDVVAKGWVLALYMSYSRTIIKNVTITKITSLVYMIDWISRPDVPIRYVRCRLQALHCV